MKRRPDDGCTIGLPRFEALVRPIKGTRVGMDWYVVAQTGASSTGERRSAAAARVEAELQQGYLARLFCTVVVASQQVREGVCICYRNSKCTWMPATFLAGTTSINLLEIIV